MNGQQVQVGLFMWQQCRCQQQPATHSRSHTHTHAWCVPTHSYSRNQPQVYVEPAKTFKADAVPPPVFTIPVMEQGRAALEDINAVSVAVVGKV